MATKIKNDLKEEYQGIKYILYKIFYTFKLILTINITKTTN